MLIFVQVIVVSFFSISTTVLTFKEAKHEKNVAIDLYLNTTLVLKMET